MKSPASDHTLVAQSLSKDTSVGRHSLTASGFHPAGRGAFLRDKERHKLESLDIDQPLVGQFEGGDHL